MGLPPTDGRSLELALLASLNVYGSDEGSGDGACTQADDLLSGLASRSDLAHERAAVATTKAVVAWDGGSAERTRRAGPTNEVGIRGTAGTSARPDEMIPSGAAAAGEVRKGLRREPRADGEVTRDERPRSRRSASMGRTRNPVRWGVLMLLGASMGDAVAIEARDKTTYPAGAALPIGPRTAAVVTLTTSQVAEPAMSMPPWVLSTDAQSMATAQTSPSKPPRDNPIASVAPPRASGERTKIVIGAGHGAPKLTELFTWDVAEEHGPRRAGHGAPKATAPPVPDDGRDLF